MDERFVRRDRRIYEFSHCILCGTGYGGPRGQKCRVTTCLACSTPQCMVNGLGRGSCGICLVGFLPGWAGMTSQVCGYKGCGQQAVAYAPRVKRVCKGHLARAGLAEKIAAALADRDRTWVLMG